MVNDQEPRYRLVDSDGNVVGSLFQNADGNVEIQDETGTGSVFGPDGIVTPAIDAGSVSTEEATVGGQPAAKSVTDDSDGATHTGDLVEVGPGETEIVFDVSDPVDIISGNIYAGEVGEVRAITTDGQVTVGGNRKRGLDRTSDAFLDVRSVPNISDVETLEFDNASTSVENEYGWVVITA